MFKGMFQGPDLLDGRYPKISGVKPLVDVISCPKWAFPAVQQVFGRSPKAFAAPYELWSILMVNNH